MDCRTSSRPALSKTGPGQLWVGTYHGVARLVDGKVIPWTKTEGATGDLIFTLFEDREGNLWVGTQDGLYRLRPARFTAYTAEQGLITRCPVLTTVRGRSGLAPATAV